MTGVQTCALPIYGTNANDYLIATADALLDGIANVSGSNDVADIDRKSVV